jgi:Ser-tRNA(Ala) deacylase AlaX
LASPQNGSPQPGQANRSHTAPHLFACFEHDCFLELWRMDHRSYSRIDFKIEGFSLALVADLEKKINTVLAENHSVTANYLSEEEFRNRGYLIRSLEAKPPVSGGWVRVVEIQGFEAQACGGTHVKNTSEVGRLSIFRTENKGKINKRLYARLERSPLPSSSS